MESNNIVLISILKEELRQLIKDVVKSEINAKREKELLDFKETCQFLNVCPSTLHKLKAKNMIPYNKIGKKLIFKRNEILAAMTEAGYFSKQKKINSSS